MNKKTKITVISTIIILLAILVTLWINGTIPKQIAKISSIIYTKINFPKMELEYINVEWSKYHGAYLVTFKDKNNQNQGFVISPKYFPIIPGQGVFGMQEEYREKYEEQNNIQNDNNIQIKIQTLTKQGATITIHNNQTNQIGYDEWFRIDKKQDEKWTEVEIKNKDYQIKALGYKINGKGKAEEKIDWSNLYGTLEKGQYRLVKKIDNRHTAVEFTIE